MTTTDTQAAEPAAPPSRLLFVDDEPGILAALKRIFHSQGHTLFTAESGEEGLKILETEPIDAVISDMRMPGMNGAEFLEEVFKRRPETKRILLTGFADAADTIAAINRGKIWRYIAKPWNEEELIATVNQALTHRNLMAENARLLKENAEQNAALKALNANLEEKVAQRTEALSEANRHLRSGFVSTVNLFAGLVEQRAGLAGHSRRVAALARQLAETLGLDDVDVQDVIIAALLIDIGKLGLPDNLLSVPFNALPIPDKQLFMKHPAKGAQLLAGIEQLAKPALLLRHQHEYLDGSGYPNKLTGLEIPLGARILAVANDYDALLHATMMQHLFMPEDARAYITQERGKHYDPAIVDALHHIFSEHYVDHSKETVIQPHELLPGLVLSRDVRQADGNTVVTQGHPLTLSDIDLIRAIQPAGHPEMPVYVMTRSLHEHPEFKPASRPAEPVETLAIDQLKPGQRMAEPVLHPSGYLILSKGMTLNAWAIKELSRLAANGTVPTSLKIHT